MSSSQDTLARSLAIRRKRAGSSQWVTEMVRQHQCHRQVRSPAGEFLDGCSPAAARQ
jgi:hypothetical protein